MRSLHIDGKVIGDDGDCFVIAEVGHNHQGNLDTAKDMFRVAKECGADAVKLQKRSNRSLYTKEMFNKPYDHENSYGKIYGEHREALEFGADEYKQLLDYSKEIGITMFSTAFDFESVDFLEEIGMPAYKIASGDVKNVPLLTYVAESKKPIFLSTGGATIEDVQRAYDTIMPTNENLCLLQCTSGYPAKFEELNLNVIRTYRKRFPNIIVGLSSHDNGISMPVAGYMLGASVIEKHFTLNRTWKGTDHAFSLNPGGLRKMVRDLRRARAARGDGVKRIYESEVEPIMKMSKKLVAARDLPEGHCIRREDIAIKSPGDGLPPYEMEKLIGRTIRKPVQEDENISFELLNGSETASA